MDVVQFSLCSLDECVNFQDSARISQRLGFCVALRDPHTQACARAHLHTLLRKQCVAAIRLITCIAATCVTSPGSIRPKAPYLSVRQQPNIPRHITNCAKAIIFLPVDHISYKCAQTNYTVRNALERPVQAESATNERSSRGCRNNHPRCVSNGFPKTHG